MIHLIMGLKGSGKTKKMIDSIQEAIASANGDVVCIEYGQKLTYDLPYKVRLVDSKEYGICNPCMLKGLLSGLHAGNYDITHVFIDSLYKMVDTQEGVEDFLAWLEKYSEAENMKFTITISADIAEATDGIKKYF